MEFVVIGIIICGVIFVGSILGFVANGKVSRLEAEVARLRYLIETGITPKPEAHSETRATPQIKTAAPVDPPVPAKTSLPAATSVPAPEPAAPPPAKAAALKSSEPPARTAPFRPSSPPKSGSLPKLKKPKRNFEQEIGARWAVWVGGLTLALGAIFLLRFAAEAGFFSPALRVGLAGLLGIVSIGAGEFLRRKDAAFFAKTLKMDDIEKTAYIPGILTGVGIFALYGAVYAAYALYGLILPFTAFAGMAAVSFTALTLSLIQGPRIAALGLIGSLVTPMLVSASPPNFLMLFSYLSVVTAASLFLSRVKSWGWLTSAAMFGALFWMWKTVPAAQIGVAFVPWALFAGGLFGASVRFGTQRILIKGKRPKTLFDIKFDPAKFTGGPALIWFAIWAVIIAILDFKFKFVMPQHAAALLAAAALMLTGYLRPRATPLIVLGGGLAFMLAFGYAGFSQSNSAYDLKGWLITAGPLIALFIALTFLKMRHERLRQDTDGVSASIWAALGTALPLAAALTAVILPRVETSHLAGLMMVLLAANTAQAVLASRISSASSKAGSSRSHEGPAQYFGPAAFYAAGAAIAYTFAVIFGLDGWQVSLAFMAGILLAVGAHRLLPESILKVIACGFAALTAAHVLLFQITDASAVSPRVIFNALWFYLALPAALCAGAAWVLQKDKDDVWPDLLKGAALTFAALFAVFQVRHLMNGGNLLAATFSFDEMALQVAVGLCFTLGGMRLGKTDSDNPGLLSILSMGVSALTLALFVLGVCFAANPLLNDDTLVNGNFVFNSLALAYLLPALVLAGIAWMGRRTRPKAYVRICGALSLFSFMLYLTTQIRFGFSGTDIALFENWPGDVELYAISAAWLTLGIVLLALGIKLKRQDIRLASAVVIVLTVLKAFIIDMASLEGALRALSFVVLGVVLIVIGRVYQRLLFQESAEGEAA